MATSADPDQLASSEYCTQRLLVRKKNRISIISLKTEIHHSVLHPSFAITSFNTMSLNVRERTFVYVRSAKI